MGGLPSALTFIVRLTETEAGRLTGVVERARTGEKHRFDRPDAIGELIVRMLRGSPVPGDDGSEDRGPAPEGPR